MKCGSVAISSSQLLLRQLLFELFDRLEEVAKFFDAGEGFVGGKFHIFGMFNLSFRPACQTD